MAPINGYFEFDAQPPSAMPYTPSEASAKMNSRPTLRSVTCNQGPKGITENDNKAGINDTTGAAIYKNLFALVGTTSSLKRNFSPSAIGCSRPKGPTRVGPGR